MSYGVQSAGLFGTTAQSSDSGGINLRPFANLDLTEEQRKAIRSILSSAKSQGLSQTEVEQQINAILTPTQQTTLQSDIAAQSSKSSSSGAASSSSQATQNAPPPPPGGNPFSDPNGPFANLDLSSSQQSEIAQIFASAKSQGLTIDQINAKIDTVLTSAQQATFSSDVQNLPQPPGASGTPGSSDALGNLNLTDDQKSQIQTILENAQSNGTSQSDVLAQIETVLTPSQQAAFLQDVQTAQASVSGRSRDGNGGTSASSNTLTETDVQNQVAAATSLILRQLQSEVGASA